MAQMTSASQWWGRHRITQRRTSYWQIGPLHLWIQNLPHQWRLSWEHSDDWLDPNVRLLPELENEDPPDGILEDRFTFRESADQLTFSPALADRTVVTRLETPLHVLPGEDVMLYVSTPLWVRVEMTEPHRFLREVPSYRLSDTWCGPVGAPGGELGYSSRTPAVLQLQDVLFRPHCAITAVHLKNLGATSLHLERLNLPFPRLSLFYSPRSGFWTEMVVLERKEDAELASLRLEHQPPPESSPTQFVAEPRLAGENENMVFRAFSALFREKGES
ncbi:MAG: hypothetical protein NDI61_10640 [Bdellovibrionaceae bacterium]|nr:hypothetical protein [Pseudobdellovibrionaceae bacterium]